LGHVVRAIVRLRLQRAREFLRLRRAVPVLLASVLAACAGPVPRSADALARAADAGFTRLTIPAGGFDFFALRRGDAAAAELTIYIEGDGRAWRRGAPPADPTPRHPLGLALALADPGPDVLYLARPCQFLPGPPPDRCRPELWSTERYGEAVVAATDEAIDRLAGHARRLTLIGHSGGGAVAVLVAARRSDVVQLVTVAANLDHERWTDLHDVTPLTGSLNPADAATAVQNIPQVHFAGGRDRIVPAVVVESFLERMSDRDRAVLRVEPEFDHACCWVAAWPRLLGGVRR
jgi:hypothetical protein